MLLRYPALLAELMKRGWSDADVARLTGGNILRIMTAPYRVAAAMADDPPVNPNPCAAP